MADDTTTAVYDAATECYRPRNHDGPCGEPMTDAEDDERILSGRCGARTPTGVLYA
jgi:hypothetical protein